MDCFLERPDKKEKFDGYWHTRIGTIDEYLSAARAAGLKPQSVENISRRTEHFWTTTIALMEAEAKERELAFVEALRRKASLSAHAVVRQGLADGSFSYALMSFSNNP